MNLGDLGPCCVACGRSPHDGPCPPPQQPDDHDPGRRISEGEVGEGRIAAVVFGFALLCLVVGPPIGWFFGTYVIPLVDAWFRYWGMA